uniref:NADH-ubiquinone oxidoreductase chain 1 n=1 Tax=Carpoglyphus lactis TaxID=223459 RepID=A0A7D5A8J6_CARLC|nr:NADH dehydrogenase subunit 1 [Carpoglyphus lactis]QKV10189.1 NADH dehydrogenase subunit 1 [Carpoglyphus lactis]
MYNLSFLLSIIGVLLSVAFFTLLERKIMSLMHYRVGPNKVVIYGVSQPMSDAAKLLTKENMNMSSQKKLMFYSGPTVSLCLMVLVWEWSETKYSMMSPTLKIFIILGIMSLTAYGFILSSWGSNSKYSLIGGFRAVAQVVSYEVCLILFLMIIIFLTGSYKFMLMTEMQKSFWFMMFMPPLFITWVMLCMAESNRTPFDLAEGESELVSGFNVEYGGGMFALIFIAEYGMIMFMSALTAMFFMGSSLLLVKTMLMCITFIWVRCAFPRVKYDKLMNISWKMALPYSLSLLLLSASLCML